MNTLQPSTNKVEETLICLFKFTIVIVSSSITTEYVVRFVISNYEIKEVMIEELNKKKV